MLLGDADQGFLSTFLLWGAQGPVGLQTEKNTEVSEPDLLQPRALSCSPQGSAGLPGTGLGGTEGVDSCREMPCKEPGKEARNAWCGAQGHGPASQVCWPFHPPAEAALQPQRKCPPGPLPVPSLGTADSRLSEPHHLPVFCCSDEPGMSASLENAWFCLKKKKKKAVSVDSKMS